MAEKVCKHQWRYLDKRHSVEIGKTIYFFHCGKCLKFRKVNSDLRDD